MPETGQCQISLVTDMAIGVTVRIFDSLLRGREDIPSAEALSREADFPAA
jgi:hypothetical protein